MAVWLAALVLGAVAAQPDTQTNASQLFVVKCCLQGEHLNSDLRKCQPFGNGTASQGATVDEDTTVWNVAGDNMTVSAHHAPELPWLPREIFSESIPTVLFGQRPNCSDRRTLRMANTGNSRAQWLRNGSMLLRSPTAHGATRSLVFEPEDFCVDTYTAATDVTAYAVVLCPCDRLQCVSKCCAVGKAKFCDGDDCNCEEYEANWKPFHPDLPPPEIDFAYEVLADNDGVCPDGFDPWIANPWIYPVHFTRTYWTFPGGDLFRDVNVCGDAIVRGGEAPRQGVVRCYRSPPFWEIVELGLALHMPASALLALAIATILAVPRRRVSPFSYVHDHAMCCHATSLLASSLTWSFFVGASSSVCMYTPIVIYFSLVSASLWLNVICINMVCGFWKPLGLQHRRLGGARGMFACYSLYAWGISAAMTAFTSVMWYSSDVPQWLIRPTLHETRTCFREEDGEGKMATFAYFYGPMAGLLLANALLFSSTAVRVRQLRRNSTILANKLSNGKEASLHNRRSVIVYIKLLWLVGVTEMAVDVAAWASNSNEYYFAFGASCLDLARAAAIFALCCCKRRTLAALRQRLCACACACRRRAARSSQDMDLPGVGGRTSKGAPDDSCVTEVTLCSSVDERA